MTKGWSRSRDEATECRRPQGRNVPSAVDELEGDQHITSTGRGSLKIGKSEGEWAQPSPLLQARRRLWGILNGESMSRCVRVSRTMANQEAMWMSLLPIASCLSPCKKHFFPSSLYVCALGGELEPEIPHQ